MTNPTNFKNMANPDKSNNSFDKLISLTTAGVLFLSLLVSALNFKSQEKLATLNAILKLEERYDSIRYDLRGKLEASKNPKAAQEFYSRFWRLQTNAFTAWTQGFIPNDIYISWLNSQKVAYSSSNSFNIKGVSYQQGYNQVQDRYRKNKIASAKLLGFFSLMDFAFGRIGKDQFLEEIKESSYRKKLTALADLIEPASSQSSTSLRVP